MRFLMVLCLLLMGASAFAEDEAMRDVKTANPFILLHPESQQAAAEAYYAAVEKNVFNGPFRSSMPSLLRYQPRWR